MLWRQESNIRCTKSSFKRTYKQNWKSIVSEKELKAAELLRLAVWGHCNFGHSKRLGISCSAQCD